MSQASYDPRSEVASFNLRGEGQSVIVTGGGSGLGRAFAECFSEAGYMVAILDVDEAASTSLVKDLAHRGHEAVALKTDVTDPDQVAQAFLQVRERWGRIDVVINNAGVLGRPAPIEDLDLDVFDHVLGVNLKAPFLVCKEAVRCMRSQGTGGCIVNVASITANTGAAVYPAYSAAKSGVVALTRSLARRVGSYQIRVNCLSPGSILGTRFLETSEGVEMTTTQRIQLKAGLMQKIPMGRAAHCRDVAHVALFLASPLARHVHGSTLTVDGGEALGRQ